MDKEKENNRDIKIKPDGQEPSRGIHCPACGCGHMKKVRDSRPISGGRVRRYRICRNCGRQVRTIEKIDPAEYDGLIRLKENN